MPDIDHQHDTFLVAFMDHLVFERIVKNDAFPLRPLSSLLADPKFRFIRFGHINTQMVAQTQIRGPRVRRNMGMGFKP